MNSTISLNGKWKFCVDEHDEGVGLGYWQINYDDSTWNLMDIPANWYLNGLDYNGVVWFRHEFNLDFADDDLISLIFEGIDYYAKIWLNGNYLGAHEGYFAAFKFQIAGKLLKKKNILVVRCCAPHDPGFPLKKKLFKGGLVHWDLRPGTVSLRGQEKGSGGIWQSIFLRFFKRVDIKDIRISPLFKDTEISALIDLTCYNFRKDDLETQIKLTIDPLNFTGAQESYEEKILLKPKSNNFQFEIIFKEPQLWWTWDLGNPNLYKLKTEIYTDNKLVNEEESIFGFRCLEEKEDGWYLNGVPIFLRGSCYFSSCWLSEMTSEKFEEDIRLVKYANMNILRLGYHVEPQKFYEVCDREGVLIWQDFPMLWDYDVTRVRAACKQMKELILQFYNHPSIILWCCHCEPMGSNQLLLDIPLKKTIEKLDKCNRKILLRAEMKDHPFVGWYFSSYYNFLTLPGGKNPNEFGAQSLPNANSKFWLDLGRENWWPINNEWEYRDFQKLLALYLAEILKGHKGGVTLKQFIKLSQLYQSKLLKFGIESFRRGKGKIHGSILFTFNDAWPSITWSIVDYFRNPKDAYFAVQKAYQPVLCSIELPTFPIPKILSLQLIVFDLRELFVAPLKAWSWNEYFTRESTLTANLWIINDYNHKIIDAKLKCELKKENKTYFTKEYKLNIPSSCSKLVKPIRFKFSKDMEFGEYLISVSISDNKGIKISENDLKVYLNSSWRKMSQGLSRFFGIFKGFLAAILGQDVQLKMFVNAFLKRYQKLAERSWCLE